MRAAHPLRREPVTRTTMDDCVLGCCTSLCFSKRNVLWYCYFILSIKFIYNFSYLLALLEPSPCLFEQIRIWPFHTVRSVGRVVYTFSGRTFCQLAPQKDDYQSVILIIVFLGGAKPLFARKNRGSARVVVLTDIINRWHVCNSI